jgi:hypothetical protein
MRIVKRIVKRIACLWPGFSALWVQGRWDGLATAVAFTILLNGALATTFAGQPSAVTPRWAVPVAAWVLVLVLWVLATWLARTPSGAAAPRFEELLREAQTQYLKGHWLEAESLLGKLLKESPGDLEGRLLLASVWRRTGRAAQARRLLTELRSDESAGRWLWEIEGELTRIVSVSSGDESQRRAA